MARAADQRDGETGRRLDGKNFGTPIQVEDPQTSSMKRVPGLLPASPSSWLASHAAEERQVPLVDALLEENVDACLGQGSPEA
jgi:hypothetical protein